MSGPACRLCAAPLTDLVLDLGETPLSNALLEPADLARREPMYPLRAFVCRSCWLVQVPDVASREQIFGDYVYASSYSTTWRTHVERFAVAAKQRFALDASSLVVELASNDGYLLRCFADAAVRVLGVEPAHDIAKAATAAGIPTEIAFFGEQTAKRLSSSGASADLLVGNNVLAHVPDLHDFVEGLRLLLKPNGVVSLEFPHLFRTIERCEFDTIYHEHFSYFSLSTARRALAAHGLEIFDVDELTTHGGSLRVYAAHAGQRVVDQKIQVVLAAERAAGLETMAPYAAFAAAAGSIKSSLLAFFDRARAEGRTVAGYGAPAKATTLLNYCGITAAQLPYTVDRSPRKQGRYIPGVRVPIASPERLAQTKPDYVLILPWNIQHEIEEQMAMVSGWGGRFVVPIPKVAVM